MKEMFLYVGDEFVSNNGGGPLRARIIEIAGDNISLERWKPPSRRSKHFILTRQFISSKKCGWMKVQEAAR